jgi:hypothetical protein
LKSERMLGPASVNLALASVDHLYRQLGMDRADVRRERLPQTAPRALSREEQRRLLLLLLRGGAGRAARPGSELEDRARHQNPGWDETSKRSAGDSSSRRVPRRARTA